MQIGELRESEKPRRCAYCHAPLDAGPVTCSSCGTQLHLDCAAVARICPTLGCKAALQRTREGSYRLRVLALFALLVILALVIYVRSRPFQPYVPPTEGEVTAKRWTCSVTVIERLAPREKTESREVVVWKSEPYDTSNAERWKIKRVETTSGSELPIRWPNVALIEGEREYTRSETHEFDVACPTLNRTFTFRCSSAEYSGRRVGDRGVVSEDAKYSLSFEPIKKKRP